MPPVVEVMAYSNDWPSEFDRVADDLKAALAPLPELVVEHVGSTSVPGLAAKPVIDIDVIVSPSDVAAAVVLQKVLAASDLTEGERHQIWRLNDPSVAGRQDVTSP